MLLFGRWHNGTHACAEYLGQGSMLHVRVYMALRTRHVPRTSPCLCRYLKWRSTVHRANRYSSAPSEERGHVAATTPAPESSSRPRPTVDRVIRVSHAGEFAANRIYEGQLSVLGDSSVGATIQVMSLSLSSLYHLVYNEPLSYAAYAGPGEGSSGALQ